MKRLLLALLFATPLVLLAAGAQAQTFPTKPVTLIVPWPAGGSSDLAFARTRRRDAKAPRAADHYREQGRCVGHSGSGANGRHCQTRRLHRLANADHGVPSAVHHQDHVRSSQGLHLRRRAHRLYLRRGGEQASRPGRPSRNWSTTPRPIRARSSTAHPAPAPACTSAWSRSPRLPA